MTPSFTTDIRSKFRSVAEARPELEAETPKAAPAPPQSRQPRPNQHPGRCTDCQQWVVAGAGVLGPKVDNRWTVRHSTDGRCPLPAPRAEAKPAVDNPWPGVYTVEFSAEEGDYLAFEVTVQSADSDFAPGKTILAWLAGPERESVSLGFLNRGRFSVWNSRKDRVTERLAKAIDLLLDPATPRQVIGLDEVALDTFPHVLVAKYCIRCGDLLTKPTSIAAGIGPVCATKGS